jgi:hypothetical protein
MKSIGYRLAALAAILVGLGCSSKTSVSVKDGGSEAGVAMDGKSMDGKGVDSLRSDVNAMVDGGRGVDTRDVGGIDLAASDVSTNGRDAREVGGIDVAALEASVAVRDTRDAGSAIDGERDARDSAGARNDASDSPLGGTPDGSVIDVGVDSRPAALGTCASPIVVQLNGSPVNVTVSTAAADHHLDSPCASNGGDVIVKFRVPTEQPQLVYADTFGAAWNTVLFFSDTCDKPTAPTTGAGMVACNDDACGTGQSQVVAALGLGYHYLIVSGANGESGDVTVHIQTASLGNGSVSVLPHGTGVRKGTTSGSDSSDLCDASGPKDNYWWLTCPTDVGGDLNASTCQGTNWDTVLSLQIPRDKVSDCNDDDYSCGMQSTIKDTVSPGAGIQVLIVGGATGTSMGDYSLTYTRP